MEIYKMWRLLALVSVVLTCCLSFHLWQSSVKQSSANKSLRLQMGKRKWSAEEDSKLLQLFDKQQKPIPWISIAQTMNRTTKGVKVHYQILTRPKTAWRKADEFDLMRDVAPLQANGTMSWGRIQQAYFPNRSNYYVCYIGKKALQELGFEEWSKQKSELLKQGDAASHLSPTRRATEAEKQLIKEVAHLKKNGMTWHRMQQLYFPNRSWKFVSRLSSEVLDPFKIDSTSFTTHKLPWDADDMKLLRQGVGKYGKNWEMISTEFLPHHSPNACKLHWWYAKKEQEEQQRSPPLPIHFDPINTSAVVEVTKAMPVYTFQHMLEKIDNRAAEEFIHDQLVKATATSD